VDGGDPREEHVEDPVLTYFEELDDATMTLAWGPDKTSEDRRRIVLAATIFGRQFEERMNEHPPETPDEKESQRFLMGLMNAVISEFAEREGLDSASAAAFLGDIGTRDYVLELNEVLEEYAADPEKPLNEHLRAAVESRQEKARWSRHWSSG
jgi:hypothetical protein